MKYFVYAADDPVALLGFNSAAWRLAPSVRIDVVLGRRSRAPGGTPGVEKIEIQEHFKWEAITKSVSSKLWCKR
jgi:hypothetical protein